MECGLCYSENIYKFAFDSQRNWQYFHCENCDLVFRDPSTFLKPAEEKKRYGDHQNSIEDQGYVEFLSPAVNELLPFLREGDRGLDYGCGPGPILQTLFSRKGFIVDNYDPYFFPALDSREYDFITCTEVAEHAYEPQILFTSLNQKLKTGGLLLVMTSLRAKDKNFLDWYYRLDNTHVSFYSQESMDWISSEFGLEPLLSRGIITLWRKKFSVVSKISI